MAQIDLRQALVKLASDSEPTRSAGARELFDVVTACVRKWQTRLGMLTSHPELDASDHAQGVMIRLYLAAQRYDPSRPAEPWIDIVTQRHMRTIRQQAKSSRRMHGTGPAASLNDLNHAGLSLSGVVTARSPESHPVDTGEELGLLLRALRQLLTRTEYYATVGHARGYSYSEIARRIGVAVKTVDNARERTRRKLQAIALHYGATISIELIRVAADDGFIWRKGKVETKVSAATGEKQCQNQ